MAESGRFVTDGKEFLLPSRLAESMVSPNNEELADWVELLPSTICELVDRWSLELDEPYEPGGACSWVAPARRRDGTEVVLKVGFRHPEAEHEAEALYFWDGAGVVLLYESHRTEQTCALLLERCTPGTPLSQACPEPEQDEIIAAFLRRLWKVPAPGHSFRPLQTMCDQWVDEMEQHFSLHPQRVDPGLVRKALQIFRSFSGTVTHSVLLLTDLHADNVLAAQREPWLVIDPKPYVGDPTYDVVQHMLNCLERLDTDPDRLAERMADLTGVDAMRVKAWLFARCVQEGLSGESWSEPLKEIASRLTL
jgi:streptomycin 6-kinase